MPYYLFIDVGLVFSIVITNFNMGFVDISLCREGRVEMVNLTLTLWVIRSDGLYSNYVNTNIKHYRLLQNVLLTNVRSK